MVNVHLYAQDVLNSAVYSVRVPLAHDSLSMPLLSEVTECHEYSSLHFCLWYGMVTKEFAQYNYSCNIPQVQQCHMTVYIFSM